MLSTVAFTSDRSAWMEYLMLLNSLAASVNRVTLTAPKEDALKPLPMTDTRLWFSKVITKAPEREPDEDLNIDGM